MSAAAGLALATFNCWFFMPWGSCANRCWLLCPRFFCCSTIGRLTACHQRTIRAGGKFRVFRQLLLEKLPLLGLAIASSVATIIAQETALQPLDVLSLRVRIANSLIACATYLRQLCWPEGLAAFYPLAVREITAPKIVLSLAVLIAVSAIVFLFRRRRYFTTGWLWYLVMLAPVIGIVQVGSQAHADRYTYLPQIGLAILVTWAATDFLVRWRYHRPLLAALVLLIVGSLMVLARNQAAAWKDSETLWTQALSRTSNNLIAHLELGEAVYRLGKTSEAIKHFERALRNPSPASLRPFLIRRRLARNRPAE